MHYDPHVKDMIDERVAGGHRTHGSPTGLLHEGSGDIYDHRAAWEALEGLLSSGLPLEYASEGRSLLILGAAESGKTHLLQAFRRHVHYRELGAYAYLRLSSCVDSTGRILLGEMIDSLERPYRESSSSESTLRRISNALVADPSLVDPELIARFRSEADEDDARRLANRISNKLYLNSERFMEVDPDLLKALLYLQKDGPLVQMLVSRYLRCEVLGNLDRRVLGDIVSRTEDGDPKGMVEHLGRVTWALLGGPLVIGVDQDDPQIDREVLRRGLRFVGDITDRLSTSVVVVACRSETWRDHQGFLPRLVVRRLENDPVPVSVRVRKRDDQVLDLVKDRMQLLNAAFQRRVARRDSSEPVDGSFDGASIRHLFTPNADSADAQGSAVTPASGALIRASDAAVAAAGLEVTEFLVPALEAAEFNDGLAISDLTTPVEVGEPAADSTSADSDQDPSNSSVSGLVVDAEELESVEDMEFDPSAWIEESAGPDALVIEPTSIVAPEAIVGLEELFVDPQFLDSKVTEEPADATAIQITAEVVAEQTTDATAEKDGAEIVRTCPDAVARMNAQWATFLNRRRPRAPISETARQDLLAWALQASGAELPRPMRVAVQKHDQGLEVTIENRSTTKHALVCLCDDDAESGELTRKIRKIAGSANGHAVTLLRTDAFPDRSRKGAAAVRRQQAAGWRTDVVDEATLQDLRAVRSFVEAHADDPILPRWLSSERPLLGKRFLSDLLVGPSDLAVDAPAKIATEPAVGEEAATIATPVVGPLEALALASASPESVTLKTEATEVPAKAAKSKALAARSAKKTPVTKTKKSKAPATKTTKSKAPAVKSAKSKAPAAKSAKSKALPAESAKSKVAAAKSAKSKAPPAKSAKSKAPPAKSAKSKALPAESAKSKALPAKSAKSKAPAAKSTKSKAPAAKSAKSKVAAAKSAKSEVSGAKAATSNAKTVKLVKAPGTVRRVAASARTRSAGQAARRGA